MKFAVFLSTPWNMTEQDFVDFANCSAVSSFLEPQFDIAI